MGGSNDSPTSSTSTSQRSWSPRSCMIRSTSIPLPNRTTLLNQCGADGCRVKVAQGKGLTQMYGEGWTHSHFDELYRILQRVACRSSFRSLFDSSNNPSSTRDSVRMAATQHQQTLMMMVKDPSVQTRSHRDTDEHHVHHEPPSSHPQTKKQRNKLTREQGTHWPGDPAVV